MKWGLLSGSSTTSNGFGWHLTAIPERLSGCMFGMHVGSRDHVGAEALWKSLPPVYRQCAVCYTDLWSAYEQVFPQNRHRAVGKESGKTNRIERFNLTLRQRISRLVRKTLSFSKKIEAHIGTIWNFIHNYNAEISPKLAITTY